MYGRTQVFQKATKDSKKGAVSLSSLVTFFKEK